MANELLNNLNCNKNQLIEPVMHNSAAAPLSPVVGQEYYNTATNNSYYWNGTFWVETRGYREISSYVQVGTSPYERWYVGGMQDSNALVAGTPVANRLYALPLATIGRLTVDRIGFNVTGLGVLSSCRVGIYASSPNSGNLYPTTLVVDGGDFSTTGALGTKITTISVVLNPNSLYWVVMLAAGTTVAGVRGMSVPGVFPILGLDNTLGTTPGVGFFVTQTYGSLPTTFPAGATPLTAVPIPAIAIRASAIS